MKRIIIFNMRLGWEYISLNKKTQYFYVLKIQNNELIKCNYYYLF